jgi:hypothetical protein
LKKYIIVRIIILLCIGKFGCRRTAPTFENAPSDHRPIFSGQQSAKSSSSSSSNSFLGQNRTTGFNTPITPPVRITIILNFIDLIF